MIEDIGSRVEYRRAKQTLHAFLFLLAVPVVPVVIFLSSTIKNQVALSEVFADKYSLLESTSDSVYCEVEALLQSRFLKL